MNTSVSIFQFDTQNVRVVIGENGEPLFVGKDICAALGFINTRDALSRHCRGVVKRYPIVDSLGRMQNVRVLTEADMFRLIVSSSLPSAEAFERLVFEEILPSIRKTGSYQMELDAELERFKSEFMRAQSRQHARLEAPDMTAAVQALRQELGKDIKPFHFSCEYDLINRIALGVTAKKFREHHELLPSTPIRDVLSRRQIECILSLQRANTAMIHIGHEFEYRKDELLKLFNRRHREALIAEVQLLEA